MTRKNQKHKKKKTERKWSSKSADRATDKDANTEYDLQTPGHQNYGHTDPERGTKAQNVRTGQVENSRNNLAQVSKAFRR